MAELKLCCVLLKQLLYTTKALQIKCLANPESEPGSKDKYKYYAGVIWLLF